MKEIYSKNQNANKVAKNNTIDTKIANNRMPYTQYRNKKMDSFRYFTCVCMKGSIIPSRAYYPGYSYIAQRIISSKFTLFF